jgi:hypothetical protein
MSKAHHTRAKISTNGCVGAHKVHGDRALVVGCHIDVFELPHRKGKMRRLPGPASYLALRGGGDGKRASVQIGSIEVGPNAFVICFDSNRSARRRLRLTGGQIIERFADARISTEIDSVEVFEQNKTEGTRG